MRFLPRLEMKLPQTLLILLAASIASIDGTTTQSIRKYIRMSQPQDEWPAYVYETVTFSVAPPSVSNLRL
jgi:hypothetical protein